MAAQLELLYDVPDEVEAKEIADAANRLLQDSEDDVRRILRKSKLPGSLSTAVLGQKITVTEKGAGVDPATLAILVALTPLLKPFAKRGAKVAEKVALDIWAMLKQKLWDEEHMQVTERQEKQKLPEENLKPAKHQKKA
jgi:hypothetical protein